MTGVGFHPAARAELLEAVAYYEDQAEGLGAQFADEAERVVSLLSDRPGLGTPVAGLDGMRRWPLRRFPYYLLYRSAPEAGTWIRPLIPIEVTQLRPSLLASVRSARSPVAPMNPPRCSEHDYIAFLLAAQCVFSCTEAARCQPKHPQAPAHDAFSRLLTRVPPDTAALWHEAQPLVRLTAGLLVLDDTTLDKPYARHIALVTRHWSGKHRRVVSGINLQTLVWTGEAPPGEAPFCVIPCDVRLYKAGGPTKNEQLRDMLGVAHSRGFTPTCVLFDEWYSSLDNLKAVHGYGWRFLTRLRSNRTVNPDRSGHVAVSAVEIGPGGREVQLKGFGLVRVFRTVPRDGHVEHWVTNDTAMSEAERAELSRRAWGIEQYHRSLKQYCGAERSQARSAAGQTTHVVLSVRAYLRLEMARVQRRVSHFESKRGVVREAVRAFLADPVLARLPTA